MMINLLMTIITGKLNWYTNRFELNIAYLTEFLMATLVFHIVVYTKFVGEAE